ncbi:hypothetical protein ABER99_21390 [Paenibacillus glucanolyticus]|jgi:hypothetical protein|uniref:Uncharacterized protein n=1 Tax=Paenibacillus glucanolyticus TaxID=59843 RepID=A0A163G5Z1_9BACL|nr:hypothetical protein [Paenibacillus glucanolyticus]KZS44750.1 hypothetical protein AWU65_01805 [Paenibacillus glucanolyticus]OMF64416.1 hypothetical protein BK142_32040 [Paenibacillus glucanolyticus]
MTLIAGVKVGNYGCVIGDFRLTKTNTGEQFDIAQKFVFVDNSLALYMAGAVFTLGNLKNILEPKINQITLQNVDDPHGVLYQSIIDFFDRQPHNVQSAIIGVYLDVASGTNKMFRIDALSDGTKRVYNLVPDLCFENEVIGSGVIITNQSKFKETLTPLSKIFKNALDKGYNVRTATDVVEREIIGRLKELGPTVYQIEGISSVMNVSFIVGSALRVEGRTVEEFTVGENKPLTKWSYTFGKDDTGNVFLKDNSTSKITPVHMTDEKFPPHMLNQEEIFDPGKIEERDKSPLINKDNDRK